MTKESDYRAKAKACRHLARSPEEIERAALWKQRAAHWEQLADNAARPERRSTLMPARAFRLGQLSRAQRLFAIQLGSFVAAFLLGYGTQAAYWRLGHKTGGKAICPQFPVICS
jgi:hypothetical protein